MAADGAWSFAYPAYRPDAGPLPAYMCGAGTCAWCCAIMALGRCALLLLLPPGVGIVELLLLLLLQLVGGCGFKSKRRIFQHSSNGS